jgi:hypothetical protein
LRFYNPIAFFVDVSEPVADLHRSESLRKPVKDIQRCILGSELSCDGDFAIAVYVAAHVIDARWREPFMEVRVLIRERVASSRDNVPGLVDVGMLSSAKPDEGATFRELLGRFKLGFDDQLARSINIAVFLTYPNRQTVWSFRLIAWLVRCRFEIRGPTDYEEQERNKLCVFHGGLSRTETRTTDVNAI